MHSDPLCASAHRHLYCVCCPYAAAAAAVNDGYHVQSCQPRTFVEKILIEQHLDSQVKVDVNYAGLTSEQRGLLSRRVVDVKMWPKIT
jgi:hypothetical protein